MASKTAGACAVVAAMALVLALGCGNETPSPVAPAPEQPAPSPPTFRWGGDAVWFDSTYRTFYLDSNHDAYLVDVNDSTQFVGSLRSVQEMSAAYADLHRVRVFVESTRDIDHRDSGLPHVAASSVDAQIIATLPYTFGGPGEKGKVGLLWPQYNRLALIGGQRWEVFFTPSTLFDSSGDFVTFDALIAGMEQGQVKYISGDGWRVAEVGTLARTMKATRQPQ